jgi:hypothetical protein
MTVPNISNKLKTFSTLIIIYRPVLGVQRNSTSAAIFFSKEYVLTLPKNGVHLSSKVEASVNQVCIQISFARPADAQLCDKLLPSRVDLKQCIIFKRIIGRFVTSLIEHTRNSDGRKTDT